LSGARGYNIYLFFFPLIRGENSRERSFFYITFTILKKGSIIARIRVPIIHQTTIITIGSIAVPIFFTTSSISLLYFLLIFVRRTDNLPVCSHIFITEASSIGKRGFSFPLCISSTHMRWLNSTHFDTPAMIFCNSFS